MSRQFATRLLAVLGAVGSSFACEIPPGTLPNTIEGGFSIVVQNPSQPIVHNRIMNFRANGDDEHLVLRPLGVVTGDSLFLVNGRLNTRNIHAVIDLEYDDRDDTTKMFMTEREFHATALFQPVYGCDPDTDELQIRLQLVSRELDPPVLGGQLGIRLAVDTYEFRYSPPNNPLLNAEFMPVNVVIFRDGNAPTATPTTTSAGPGPTPPTIGEYDFVSCWAEPDGGRTLPDVFRAGDMTNQKCAALCAGSTYFGTQWHTECWCGPALAAGSVAAPSAQCADACAGDPAQICGGGRRLSLYRKKSTGSSTTEPPVVTTSSTTTSTTFSTVTTTSSTTSVATSSTTTATTTVATTTTTTTTTSPAGPTPSTPTGSLPPVGKFNFVSCWAEPPSGRTLSAYSRAADMTLEKCAATCTAYAYFGTQWGQECFCGNVLAEGSAAAPIAQCSYTCAGNAAQKCGGDRRLSLYQNPAFAGPSQPTTVGGYAFDGCMTDRLALRTLNDKLLRSDTMTLQTCATFCAGYTYFGAEYGTECFCGNAFAAGATKVANTQCNKVCAGDGTQFCGNGDRLSVYKLGA